MEQDIRFPFSPVRPRCSPVFNTYVKMSTARHKIASVNRHLQWSIATTTTITRTTKANNSHNVHQASIEKHKQRHQNQLQQQPYYRWRRRKQQQQRRGSDLGSGEDGDDRYNVSSYRSSSNRENSNCSYNNKVHYWRKYVFRGNSTVDDRVELGKKRRCFHQNKRV